jgi:hypothetical protein
MYVWYTKTITDDGHAQGIRFERDRSMKKGTSGIRIMIVALGEFIFGMEKLSGKLDP